MLDKFFSLLYSHNTVFARVSFKILDNGGFFMNKFGRNKVALFLTCMSVLGNKISAVNTNKSQSPQTVAAVGGGVDFS